MSAVPRGTLSRVDDAHILARQIAAAFDDGAGADPDELAKISRACTDLRARVDLARLDSRLGPRGQLVMFLRGPR